MVSRSMYRLAFTNSMVPAITVSTAVSGGCAVPSAAENWSCAHTRGAHRTLSACQQARLCKQHQVLFLWWSRSSCSHVKVGLISSRTSSA